MTMNFSVEKTQNPKARPNLDGLVFGTVFTDHMFIMKYTKEDSWHDGKVVPYGPLTLDPAAAVLHYAQELFEGMKAYKAEDGRVLLFRPDMNDQRAIDTSERICVPPLDKGVLTEAVKAVVKVDQDWIPDLEGYSLYVRPFIIATEAFLGVRAAHEYYFMVILSPVGPYYPGGLAPTKIYVEDKYVRAVVGGTGEAKIGGNYAASLKAGMEAAEKGFAQIMWLDGVERKYIEEIGTSNAFFVIDDEIITPNLTGTILPGITRDSVITLLKSWDKKIVERRITIDEVYEAHKEGRLKEAFATGTAAVVSPVGELSWGGNNIVINDNKIGEITQSVYDELTGIQTGKRRDEFGWTVEV